MLSEQLTSELRGAAEGPRGAREPQKRDVQENVFDGLTNSRPVQQQQINYIVSSRKEYNHPGCSQQEVQKPSSVMVRRFYQSSGQKLISTSVMGEVTQKHPAEIAAVRSASLTPCNATFCTACPPD